MLQIELPINLWAVTNSLQTRTTNYRNINEKQLLIKLEIKVK